MVLFLVGFQNKTDHFLIFFCALFDKPRQQFQRIGEICDLLVSRREREISYFDKAEMKNVQKPLFPILLRDIHEDT
jgi:hypothetical protein